MGKLLLELLVVFVGVYAAFLLDNRRVANEDARLRLQLYALLNDEIQIDQISPALESGESGFYTDEGTLRKRFQWYPTLVRQLRSAMADTVIGARRLAFYLESPQDS